MCVCRVSCVVCVCCVLCVVCCVLCRRSDHRRRDTSNAVSTPVEAASCVRVVLDDGRERARKKALANTLRRARGRGSGAGARVLRAAPLSVAGVYDHHGSVVYGAVRHGASRRIASCSFYDRGVHVWSDE